MSEAAIAKKAEIVKQTTDMLNAAQSAIVVDYRGLTVAEVTDLRKQLRDAGIQMSVIKNKILDRAVEGTDYEDLRSTFVGPTAVAFSDEDPIAPAKILKKFADDHDALEIKGGFIEKSVKTLDVAKNCCQCLHLHCKIQCGRLLAQSRLLPTRKTKPHNCRISIQYKIKINYLNIGGNKHGF